MPTKNRSTKQLRKPKRPTIHDVAKEAGVSIYAVSRALNNAKGVNPADREEILAVSRRLGVRPRPVAREAHFAVLIPNRHEYTPGGYITNVAFPLFTEISSAGLGLSLFSDDMLDHFTRKIFDGIFLLSWNERTVERVAQMTDTPVVVINRFSQTERFHVVGWDHEAEGRIVADYLIGRGHRRPGFIASGRRAQISTQSRFCGFSRTFRAAGLPIEPEAMETLTDRKDLVTALARLLDRNVDSIYLPGQERLGLEALQLLQKIFRRRIPEDISLIAGENPGWSEMSDPPLTTVDAPFEQMARHCVRHMCDLIENRGAEPTEVLVSTPVIERRTVATR